MARRIRLQKNLADMGCLLLQILQLNVFTMVVICGEKDLECQSMVCVRCYKTSWLLLHVSAGEIDKILLHAREECAS
jgi:hypothetical protein